MEQENFTQQFVLHVVTENELAITEDYLELYKFPYKQKRIDSTLYLFLVFNMADTEYQSMISRVKQILNFWKKDDVPQN